MSIQVKTTSGKTAYIGIDMSKYKGKTKDQFLEKEVGFWERAYSSVPAGKIKEALGAAFDAAFPPRKKEPEA